MKTPLLEVKNLSIEFCSSRGMMKAVDQISFRLQSGETLAIVGESGSGKSVTAMSLTQLLPPAPICKVEGEVLYQGENLLSLNPDEIRQFRGKEIAYIFQEPSSSLNPVFSIQYQIAEALKLHRPEITKPKEEIIRLLEMVGIQKPELRMKDYPHQLSGGMQQRVMIAMALACQPKILVADEPTTALDVTIQAQVMDLLKRLKSKTGMSVILITHNFGIVADFADQIIVMFRGQIVEAGRTNSILQAPKHPYTKALMACIPRLGEKKKRLTTIDYAQIK
jgi:ABC-type dipeptide/oligopeptide/nickel transport system ATPase component